jgi:signal transduction histidine kinase
LEWTTGRIDVPPPFDFILACARVLARAVGGRSEAESLDRLRSELSHEPSAKFARLAILLGEWKRGGFREGDREAFCALLEQLRDLYLGQCRIAADRARDLLHLSRILACLRTMRGRLRRADRRSGPSERVRALLEQNLRVLRVSAEEFAERLSRKHAVRVSDLVRRAVDEVRRERSSSGDRKTIVLTLDPIGGHGQTWVPRASEAHWLDLFRNLLRNAVEATEDRHADSPTLERDLPPVRMRLVPFKDRPGVRVEIADEGIGLSPEEVHSIWRAGIGRHGENRGRGLTEDKLAFLLANGSLQTVSRPGEGTTFTIGIPSREIPVRPPLLWRQRPIQGAATLFLAAAVVAAPAFLSTPRATVVEDGAAGVVRGVNERGKTVWERNFGIAISRCSPYERTDECPRAVQRNPDGSINSVLIATQPKSGSGEWIFLDGDGSVVWRRPITWTAPRGEGFHALVSNWQVPIRWGDPPRDAYAVNVRDCNFSPSAIQILSTEGEVIAAYYHPGHLSWHAQEDLDGDGIEELVLRGINNRGGADRSLASDVEGTWFGCVLSLGPEDLDGQAFPYTSWEGIPPASEKAYLLIPPIRPGVHGHVAELYVGRPKDAASPNIDAWLADGRSVSLDPFLRPLGIGVGDNTDASRIYGENGLPPTRFAYFREGVREIITIGERRDDHE